MSYDLEAEVLRAARELCGEDQLDAFTTDALRELIASAPRRFARLAHPRLAHLIEPIVKRLVFDGLVAPAAAGYVLTEHARADGQRSPQYLHAAGSSPDHAARDTDTAANLAIASFQWGQIIDSTGQVFKDARLFPGGVDEWDWRKTRTRHDPGIQIADLEDLLATKPDVVILSRGVELVLQVPQATIDFARRHVANVLVLQSEQAVAEYNRRIPNERVVTLLHSMC